MTIRKKIATGILLAMALGAFACLAACGEGSVPLNAPQNVRVEDEKLVWEEVEGAAGYFVEIDGEEYETETNEFDVFAYTTSLRAYEFRVQAYAEELGYDSEWTPVYTYTPEIATGWGMRLTEDGTGYEVAAIDRERMRGKLVLYSSYGGIPVKRIVSSGFEGCTELTGVLMSGITELGNDAFAGCTGLKYVICPEEAEIGDFAFSGCTSLRRIELPQWMETLSRGMFNNCTSLEEITLPEGLLEIETFAFNSCTALKSLYIPASVTEIGGSITGLCRSLTKLEVSELNEVYRSEGNCIILRENDELVRGCAGSVIPASVRTIGERAFSNCTGLTEITIPGNVKSVGGSAFGLSSDLRAVHIEEGVEEIGGKNVSDIPGMFNGSALEELEIPASVRYLSPDLTAYCAELTSLTVAEGNAVYYSVNNCILRKEDKEVVAGCKASAIPQGAARIGSYAFSGIPFTTVAIPEGITEIGERAFFESSLKAVELPSSLRVIGDSAFRKCAGLRAVRLPYGIETIGGSAFEESGLEYIAIPESVQEIGGKAFYKCFYLTAVLPGSVEKIGTGAFSWATIYTTSSCEEPEGWYKKDPMWGQTGLDYDWDMGNCAVVYDCTFGYDGVAPYVDTYTVLEDENGHMNIGYGSFRLPRRDGYVFKGFAKERGGDVAYSIKLIEPEDDKEGSYYVFSGEELWGIDPGTVLYAVWEKMEKIF